MQKLLLRATLALLAVIVVPVIVGYQWSRGCDLYAQQVEQRRVDDCAKYAPRGRCEEDHALHGVVR